jgi:hypothetical protein
MEAAIDRVMTTYRMMLDLTPDEEREVRERVARFLEGKGSDEHMLAVEGLKFLRSRPSKQHRRGGSVQNRVE